MKIFEKIFEDQSKQTKESMDAINANVDSIHSVVDIVLDDLVTQEKQRVYNLDTDYDILTLDQDEREFAIAMLYTLSQLMDETTEKQKQCLLRQRNDVSRREGVRLLPVWLCS